MDAEVIVIGAGVVGIAVTRALSRHTSASIILLEALPVVLQGASSGNSAMIHTGFDCTPGTVEARMVRRGHELFDAFSASCSSRGLYLPWSPFGALMLAMSPQELEEMRATVVPRAAQNKVPVTLLSKDEVLRLEPHVRREVCGGLLIPGEWCVDPWFYPACLLAEAVQTGRARVVPSFRVTRIERIIDTSSNPTPSSSCYSISSAKGTTLRCRLVINAAGLHGSRLEALRPEYSAHGGSSSIENPVPFDVFPRLGRFLVFDASATPLISRALIPLPTKKTKGVILFRSVYGQVIIGPTAEDPDEPRKSQADVRKLLLDEAVKKVPVIGACDVVSHYAGARPSLRNQSDYYLNFDRPALWFTLAGVRSTGLTSSLAIGEYVVETLLAQPSPILRPAELVHALPSRQALAMALRELSQQGVVSTEARHPLSLEGWPTAKL